MAQGPEQAHAQAAAPIDRAHIEQVLSGLNRGHTIQQVAISPDGKRLAWIQQVKDGEEIRVALVDDLIQGGLPKSERVSAANKPEEHCDESQLAWAPDAKEARQNKLTILLAAYLMGYAQSGWGRAD